MSARVGIEDARRDARRVVADYGVTAPHDLVVEAISDWLGVSLAETPLLGSDAQLINPRWGRPWILLSERLIEPERRRFTIAHELGHYVRGHCSLSLAEMDDPSARLLAHGWQHHDEAEADAFALELLMPEPLVRTDCIGVLPRLEVAVRIARTFGVSPRAAAVRFTELTDAACAAVLSEGGAVRWAAHSPTFGGRIRRGQPIDPRSIAGAYFAGAPSSQSAQPVPTAAWIAPDAPVTLIEHSLGSTDGGTVLTLLSAVAAGSVTGPDAAA